LGGARRTKRSADPPAAGRKPRRRSRRATAEDSTAEDSTAAASTAATPRAVPDQDGPDPAADDEAAPTPAVDEATDTVQADGRDVAPGPESVECAEGVVKPEE
jgi:hypothetical protein